MKTVKILWSGLTGHVGSAAMEQLKEVPEVEIVAGLSRLPLSDGNIVVDGITQNMDETSTLNTRFMDIPKWYQYSELSVVNGRKPNADDFDVIVDFSHPDVFEKVVELAVRMNVPLISGTSSLSNRQIAMLYDATNRIPIFRGGNFRFKVKKFIDEAVKLAMITPGNLTLYENFYKGKSLPSETSKVVQRRISEAAGKNIDIKSSATLDRKSLVCDWRIGDLRCRTVGFDELAHDVLKITKVMAKKPVRPGKFYDLNELWDDLVSRAL